MSPLDQSTGKPVALQVIPVVPSHPIWYCMVSVLVRRGDGNRGISSLNATENYPSHAPRRRRSFGHTDRSMYVSMCLLYFFTPLISPGIMHSTNVSALPNQCGMSNENEKPAEVFQW